jgi:hypothetical protein
MPRFKARTDGQENVAVPLSYLTHFLFTPRRKGKGNFSILLIAVNLPKEM